MPARDFNAVARRLITITEWGSATGDGVPYGVAGLLTNYGRMKHDEGGTCRERQPSAMAGEC